jgi:uncharacterized protein (DUF488 family)
VNTSRQVFQAETQSVSAQAGKAAEPPQEICTVGHSTHPIERFCGLLAAHGVEALADVRRYPGSRRNPQFGAEPLARSLSDAGVSYARFGDELGGRRRSRRPRQESGWRVASFAAYAEHTESAEFAAGLERLEQLAHGSRTAIMCAEADWRRCHRRLIADVLLDRGWDVLHILRDGRTEPHPTTLGPS